MPGNQVQVGGHPIGTVDEIELTDDWQAEVTISVDEELHEGTTAVIRTTSLSGIANRYISVTPGPDNAPALDDEDVITAQDTTSPVDLDQLFDTFRPKERRALRNVIQGFATSYAGRGEEANETYKYLNPGLSTTQRLLAELTRDQQVFTEFLVDGSRVVNAIAERRNDLSALTSNANQALGAIARENDALDRTLVALPPTLRQANTTFVNLRAALNDLDPLVETSKSATRTWRPSCETCARWRETRCPCSRTCGAPCCARGPRTTSPTPCASSPPCGTGRARTSRAPARRSRTRCRSSSSRAPVRPRRARAGQQAGPGDRLLRRQRPLRARLPDREHLLQHSRSAGPAEPGAAVRLLHDSNPLGRGTSSAARAAPPSRSAARTRSPTTATCCRGARTRTRSATRPTCPRTMRRLALIATTLAAGIGLLLATSATSDDGGPYEVRAIFDNAAFLVPGEEVRVAGAKVGRGHRGGRHPAG